MDQSLLLAAAGGDVRSIEQLLKEWELEVNLAAQKLFRPGGTS